MRILYLCPLIPALSGNGGRRAAYNHLLDLDIAGTEIDAVLVDVEDSGEINPGLSKRVHVSIFPRAMPKFSSNFRAKIIALLEHFLNQLPRALRVISSQHARRYIAELLRTNHYDAIVVDHFNAYGLIHDINIYCPIFYIAHNVEAAVLADQIAQMNNWKPSSLLMKMDLKKIKTFEAEICKKATGIILISSADAAIPPMMNFSHKIFIWPELPTPKRVRWQPNNLKCLLFVGSAKYFPNRDAIEWLAGTLMPKLRKYDQEITLCVAGTAVADMAPKYLTDGVSYLGFVSDSELERLHLESTLFICPVVLGGGIKIKILEASSYGLPIAATRESLNGIEYLSEHAVCFTREGISDFINKINLINSISNLRRLSNSTIEALNHALAKRSSLQSIILKSTHFKK